MPPSTQGSEQDRRFLLQSLQEFSRGVGEAPIVTKWTNSAEDVVSLSGIDSGKNLAPEQKDQAITFVLSTDDVDRHGDVISADGWVLDSYRENPMSLDDPDAEFEK